MFYSYNSHLKRWSLLVFWLFSGNENDSDPAATLITMF